MNDFSQIYDYDLITLRLITQLWLKQTQKKGLIEKKKHANHRMD